jgi:hypothetical protein
MHMRTALVIFGMPVVLAACGGSSADPPAPDAGRSAVDAASDGWSSAYDSGGVVPFDAGGLPQPVYTPDAGSADPGPGQ